MNYLKFRSTHFKFIIGFLLILIPVTIFGQYKGEPVKKDKLIQVLRSKQFQSREIVSIIIESGVDFQLSPSVESELVTAGARPPVIEAVRNNYRNMKPVKTGPMAKNTVKLPNEVKPTEMKNTVGNDYNSLVDHAIYLYDGLKDRQGALNTLIKATSLSPNNPRAYQLLGFLNLYGYKNFSEAESNWKKAISLGGSAVLRVSHDHNGTFTSTCEGSLYISKDLVRFESDDNYHTFETSDKNIKDIKVNSVWKRLVQIKQGSFRIVLKDKYDDDGKKFNFAPKTGDTDESKMIIRLIAK